MLNAIARGISSNFKVSEGTDGTYIGGSEKTRADKGDDNLSVLYMIR